MAVTTRGGLVTDLSRLDARVRALEGGLQDLEVVVATPGPGGGGGTSTVDLPWFNVKDFGAKGDGVTDNSLAIANAVSALPATGGTLFFPSGDFRYSSTLTFDDRRSVVLRGVGGLSQGGSSDTASKLMYTGTGTGISAKSTFGFCVEDLWIGFTNNSHSGNLVDLSHSGSALDATNANFTRCLIGSGSSSIQGTGVNIFLENAIVCNFIGCFFYGGNIGVSGPATTGYSNGHTFVGCTWAKHATIAVRNPVYVWSFLGCTWEPKTNGNAGAILSTGGPVARALAIFGCGCWDANTSGTWFDVDFRGMTIEGTLLAAGAVGINAQANWNGLHIAGCHFDSNTTSIALGSGGFSYTSAGNYFVGVTTRRTGSPLVTGIASAATITIPWEDDYIFTVTGTAAITSITASWAQRVVTLVFTGTAAGAGLTDGSNLKLAGNFAYTPDDSITLACDGTNWFETSRSVN